MALMAAWAIAEVLREECGVHAGIKWPNDVWIDGKKLAGILVEIVDDVVIIGMGVNAHVKTFPKAMKDTATSIFLQSGVEVEPRDLIEKIILSLRRALSELESDRGRLMDQVRSRCLLRGRWVRLKTQGEEREIEVIGMGDRGELWVMHHGQPEAIWQADEIRPRL
jgi:BirA family biotin operon repressor/biotin-[acetyl-CoA-carboxylase] ligase